MLTMLTIPDVAFNPMFLAMWVCPRTVTARSKGKVCSQWGLVREYLTRVFAGSFLEALLVSRWRLIDGSPVPTNLQQGSP